jgi:putative aldouronate transport system permease protein
MLTVTHTSKKQRWKKNDTQLFTLALPTTLWFLIFAYIPMIGAFIAFKDFRPADGFIKSFFTSRWVGFENFYYLFTNPMALLAIRNTLLYNVALISLGLAVPITLAIILSEVWYKKLAKLYQTLMFFPYFISWVIVSALVMGFLSYDWGIFNQIITAFGGEKRYFYREAGFWPFFLVFISIWKGMGHGMILYLAAITSQDKSIFEAAIIDGATKWQQIWRITIPLLKNLIVILLILSAGSLFRSDFGLFYQVPRNSALLYDVVWTIDVFVYNQLMGKGGFTTIGMASASSFLQSVVSCFLILTVNMIVKKLDPDSALI